LFLVVAPGVVGGLVPWLLSGWHATRVAVWLQVVGWVVVAVGAAVLLEAFARFVIQGVGTPAPVVTSSPTCPRGMASVLIYNRMVVGEVTDEEADRMFQALADGTRRDILHRCVQGERSVSRLADVYPMSFAAVQKHVAVLERAGLVTKERRGREQLVRTDGDAVGRARRVLEEFEAAWRGRVDRMADLLAQVPQSEKNNPSTGHGG
jgi:DNA-binding transcriptional ArsR family regulator